jgi:energy-coupling factor transport system permease protein
MVHQAHVMHDARTVLVGSATAGKHPLHTAARLSSQLLEWGMESSIITANSMQARGYGQGRRTSYRSLRFTWRDAQLAVCAGILLALSIAGTAYANAAFTFYPWLGALAPGWVYLPYAAFALFQVLVEGGERLWWALRR